MNFIVLEINFDRQNYYNYLPILDFLMNHPINFSPKVINFQMKDNLTEKNLLKIFIMSLFLLF